MKSNGYLRSPRQERELVARLTPRSGAGSVKGDIRLKGIVRVEAKTTSKNSFSVTKKMLDQIEDAALATGEMPAIVIEFLDADGHPYREICVVPSYVLDNIIDAST